jgi:probable HAF family extracellular repeat protein
LPLEKRFKTLLCHPLIPFRQTALIMTASSWGYVNHAPPGHNSGYVLHTGTFTSLDVPFSTQHSFFQAVNNNGDIVGDFNAGTATRAFLFSDGQFSVIHGPFDASSFTVTGINDSGLIVGRYTNTSGTHGFLGTPVPEPSTWLLLGSAGGALALIRGLGRHWGRPPAIIREASAR